MLFVGLGLIWNGGGLGVINKEFFTLKNLGLNFDEITNNAIKILDIIKIILKFYIN